MRAIDTAIEGVKVIELESFPDHRGAFVRYWNDEAWQSVGIGPFVADNVSISHPRVLRGLHLQTIDPQGKLVSVLAGSIFDVAVDLRADSTTFGQWVGVHLRSGDPRQLWVPPGFAHGFCVTDGPATVHYRCTSHYRPDAQVGISWNDPGLGIDWPIVEPILSERDASLPDLDASMAIRNA